jgi:YbgC/YbaW family acyl-CoA thioester hydrolase
MKKNIVERKIAWGDLDSLGIVFYPRYYEWIDASSHLFFESIGLNLNTLYKNRSIQFGLTETSCLYLRPGRYHESIRIVTKLGELTEKTLKLEHSIHNAIDDVLMVKGFEKRICMDVGDLEDIKPIPIPENIYFILDKKRDQDE